MASVTFLFLVFLVHLVLPISSVAAQMDNQNCAPFLCGRLGNIRFPYYSNESTPPVSASCKYYQVDCTVHEHPKIQLTEGGYWYEIVNISQGESMSINGRDIQNYLKHPSDGCKSLESFGLPVPTQTSKVSSPNILSVFKCNSSSLQEFFTAKQFHNTSCGEYSIYYTNTMADLIDYGSPPHDHCFFIRLPAAPNHSGESNNFLSYFDGNLFMGLHINYVCLQCESRGRECLFNKEKNYHFCASKGENNKRSSKLWVGIGITFPGVLILIVCVCFLVRKFSSYKFPFVWKKTNKAHQNVEAFLKKNGHLPTRRFSYSNVKKMTKSFTNRIGQGGYGCVYKGKLPNGHLVAVKLLNQSKGNGEEFVNEVATISRTSHVNVVSLLGFCFEGPKRALIYEFMHNGSLEKFIFNQHENQQENHRLEWGTLYQIALGIARGLEYLHRGCNTRILHFDIKPHNILLDKDFTPKISDFGLAKVCTREESIISMLEARGTIGYIAPEVFSRNFGGVSHKSDVYSYGMMVLEMVGGRKNVNIQADRTSEIYFPQWIYRRIELDEDLGLKRITNEEDNAKTRKMITMSLWCIQTDPSNRPTMSKVIEMLEVSLDSLQIPPKPFLSSSPRSSTDSSKA